jgi:peptidyl-prolyl cis-trans isomerase A (cyclophilin A)
MLRIDSRALLLAGLLALCMGCGSRETQQTPPPSQKPRQPAEAPPAASEGKEVPGTSEPGQSVAPDSAQEPLQTGKSAEPKLTSPKSGKLNPSLLNPALVKSKAPEEFKVRLETTKGDVLLQVNRAWAPLGADRFFNLVKIGYYNDVAFFRVIDGFMAQFGIHGDPKINEKWESAQIRDDPVKQSNMRGAVSFATAGPNTRTTQLFINYDDNRQLDQSGFAPFGKVIQGMAVLDTLYKDYGEGAPRGGGPSQDLIQSQGNKYLRAQFPKLDYIKRATIVN